LTGTGHKETILTFSFRRMAPARKP